MQLAKFLLLYTESWAKVSQVLQKSRTDAILSEKREIILATSQDCCWASFQGILSLSVYRESLLTIKMFCTMQRGLKTKRKTCCGSSTLVAASCTYSIVVCVSAATTICYMLSFAGGFTNSLIALDWNTYLKVEGGLAQFPNGTVPDSAYGHPPEQLPKNVVQPGYLKYVAFMAVIYFVGEQIHPSYPPYHALTSSRVPTFRSQIRNCVCWSLLIRLNRA